MAPKAVAPKAKATAPKVKATKLKKTAAQPKQAKPSAPASKQKRKAASKAAPPKKMKKKAAPPPPPPPRAATWQDLPQEVLAQIVHHLFVKDKLNNVITMVEDVASIAQVSRSHRTLAAEVLWPALGRCFAATSAGRGVLVVPNAQSYEVAHPLGCKIRKLTAALHPADVRRAYEDGDMPWCVPIHVFYERLRLRTRGISASNLGPEFGLADADMAAAGLEVTVKSRGSYGTAKLYPLGDVLSLARAKHGDAAGLAQFFKAKADAATARKAAAAAKAAAKVAARLAAVKEAVEQRGLVFDPHNSAAARYYVSGKLKKKVQEVADHVELFAFLGTHTDYYEIEEWQFVPPSEAPAAPGMLPGAPVVRFALPCYPELGPLTTQDDGWGNAWSPRRNAVLVEVVLYCIQTWVAAKGGAAAAVACPELPACAVELVQWATDPALPVYGRGGYANNA